MSNAMETKVSSILTLLLLLLLPCDAHAQESARQGGKKPSAWIKLCEMGRPSNNIGVCMTLHERVDAQTGMVLISAALRQTEGEDKEYFRVMLPPQMQDVNATIFPERMWEKILERLRKNEKLDEQGDEPQVQRLSLGLLRCSGSQALPSRASGCIGEVEATAELLANLKSSGGVLMHATFATCNCQVAFQIPLTGFAEALAGPPTNQWHSESVGLHLLSRVDVSGCKRQSIKGQTCWVCSCSQLSSAQACRFRLGSPAAFAPSFSDLKSLSAMPPFPAMPWMDSYNGGSRHEPTLSPNSFGATNSIAIR